MVQSLKVGVVALVALFALMFSFEVRAQEKKTSKCELCSEVKVVLESCRCDKCKPDKQCEKCVELTKKAEEKYACGHCSEKQCDDCAAAMKADKCKFCAAKKYIISHTYCCKNCEKAGNEKAEKCTKCQDQRAMFVKVECKEKDCPNKKG
jgi:hypothetical protein